jgi:hypothetical protein
MELTIFAVVMEDKKAFSVNTLPKFWVRNCKPFTCGTWVTGAIKDEGTTESCSVATLMKHTTAFIYSFFKESLWSEKAHQVLHVKVTQGSTVKINSLLCLL